MATRPKVQLQALKPVSLPEVMPRDDAKLTNDMLDGWRDRCLGSLHLAERTVIRDMGAVADFLRFTGRAPWALTEDDFDRWNVHLVRTRAVASATQRTYQGAVRRFLDYLVNNTYFQHEVQRRYKVSIKQLCNDQNCVPHVTDKATKSSWRAMTHSELRKFFKTLDEMIKEAAHFRTKSLRALQRDKCLFYFMYVCATRISEAVGVTVHSFLENVEFPQFEKYGRVEVLGKGSMGSGPKRRMIIIDHHDLPPMLAWYEKDVRPHLLNGRNPNEAAFFLSQGGKPMNIKSAEKRFKAILERAGLDTKNLVPHSLRRSSITHGAMDMKSTIPQQHKAGHENLGTTEGYADYPDDWVRKQHKNAIRRRIEKAKKNGDDKP